MHYCSIRPDSASVLKLHEDFVQVYCHIIETHLATHWTIQRHPSRHTSSYSVSKICIMYPRSPSYDPAWPSLNPCFVMSSTGPMAEANI